MSKRELFTKIVAVLSEAPGEHLTNDESKLRRSPKTSKEIAKEVGASKHDVNSILYAAHTLELVRRSEPTEEEKAPKWSLAVHRLLIEEV
jgi:hypothetical protein